MLDQIECTIKNLPSISFEELYTDYIDSIENHVIEAEINKVASQIYTTRNIAHAEKSIELLIKGVKEL